MPDIVIWGTGKRAERLLQYLSTYRWAETLACDAPCRVTMFLDSDEAKQGTQFHEISIAPPQHYFSGRTSAMLVIAVQKHDEIVSSLERKGKRYGEDYIFSEDVEDYVLLRCKALRHVVAAMTLQETGAYEENVQFLDQLCGGTPRSWDTGLLLRFLSGIKQQWEQFLQLHPVADAVSLQQRFLAMLTRTLFAAAHAFQNFDTCAVGEQLRAWIGVSAFAELQAASLQAFTAGDVRAWWSVRHDGGKKCVKTIGIYYPDYYGGGIQRVLSKLMPMYLQHGYRVVFFTDVYAPEKEFPLPEGVMRIQMEQNPAAKTHTAVFERYIRQEQIDVFCYHSYTASCMIYDVCMIQSLGVPVIVELHTVFSRYFGKQWLHRFLATYQSCDAVVTLSRADALFWKLNGCRTIAIPNPTQAPVACVSPKQESIILWMGRFDEPQKGFSDLPQIFEQVRKECADATLWIVGAIEAEAETFARLKADFAARGLLPHVKFWGYQTDVRPFWQQAAVYLLTSGYEGFGMVIAESKQYGVPTVLYDLPYLELLREKKGYISVPQKDTNAAAHTVVRILKDEALQQQLSREAQESLASFHRINLMAKWEEAFALAASPQDDPPLTEEERSFQIVQTLLLQEIERAGKEEGRL